MYYAFALALLMVGHSEITTGRHERGRIIPADIETSHTLTHTHTHTHTHKHDTYPKSLTHHGSSSANGVSSSADCRGTCMFEKCENVDVYAKQEAEKEIGTDPATQFGICIEVVLVFVGAARAGPSYPLHGIWVFLAT